MKGNKICILLSLLITGYAAMAKQAYPGTITLRQPDGTVIQAKIHGDEFFHYVTDSEGRVLKRGQDGFWCYGRYDVNGVLSSTGYIAGHNVPSSIMSEAAIIPKTAIMLRTAELRLQHAEAIRSTAIANSTATRADSRIVERCLIIPAEFRDKKMTYKYEDFQDLASKIKDYFQDQFPENYEFIFDVSPIVTLSKGYAEYGSNGRDGTQDAYNACKAVGEACELANAAGVDFSLYDLNEDGRVDNVFLIVAGKNEAETEIDDLIWPHSWDVTYGNVRVTLNGKEIRTYAVSSELSRRSSSQTFGFATIGTFCHEYSHVLGLMDLYDTDYEANGTANDAWTETALMVGGNYNNDGQTPPCYNAIDRDMLGIGQRETLVPGTYELEPIRLNGRYLRYDTPTEGEYYLIECRDNEGWDEFIGGSGLAIYHIDKSQNMSGYSSYMSKNVTAATRWWTNEVNCNTTHLCADMMEANPKAKKANQIFYPYTTNNSFTFASNPAFVFWDGTNSPLCITGIEKKDGNVVFKVSETSADKPAEPEELKVDTFQTDAIISWSSNDPMTLSKAMVTYGPAGKEGRTIEVEKYSDGLYAVDIDDLKPATAYTAKIVFDLNGIKGREESISFTTKSVYEGGKPYIYLKDIEGRNEDGSFSAYSLLPLKLFNCFDAKSVTWYLDKDKISTGGNCYYTPGKSGRLKAEVIFNDGSKDIIIKEIEVK